MLFDEPTSALDPELRHEVLRVMQALAEEGMTMIVVTHEMAFARKVGNRLIFMEEGKIAVDGPPAALLANPENPRLRHFLQIGRTHARTSVTNAPHVCRFLLVKKQKNHI